MLVYKYDGTIDGLFSCIFESFVNKETPNLITNEQIQLSLDSNVKIIETNYENNKRVINCIYKHAGINALNDLKYAFRSGNEQKEITIFNYACKIIKEKRNIANKFSDQVVMDFYDTIKRIGNESHRMKGFLRFNECEGGFFYAHFSPDNDIADLMLPHFTARFKDIPFVIHDVKRNILALYNGKETKVIKGTNAITVYLTERENHFQGLWKTYYNAVNIAERKNVKLMKSFLPIKYWEHLTEKVSV